MKKKKESDSGKGLNILLHILIFIITSFILISLVNAKTNIFDDYLLLENSELNFTQLISNQFPSLSNPLGIIGTYTSYFFTRYIGHLLSFALFFLVIINLIFKLAHFNFSFLKRINIFIPFFIVNLYLSNIYYFHFIYNSDTLVDDKIIVATFFGFLSALLGKYGTAFLIISLFLISLRLVFRFNPFKIIVITFSLIFKNIKDSLKNIKLKEKTPVPKEISNPSINNDSTSPPEVAPIELQNAPVNDEKDKPSRAEYQINIDPPVSNVLEDDKIISKPKYKPNSQNRLLDAQEYIKPDIESFLFKPQTDRIIDKIKLEEEIKFISQVLKDKLLEFGIEANVLNVNVGPIITQYELEPAPGIKVNRFVSLSDDLALALKAKSIRVQAPIPGRGLIGIEIPNKIADVIYMRDIFLSNEMHKSDALLSVALGKDIAGRPIVTDLAKMPHLLIAGATGSGKSVCINTIICSLLLRCSPEEVRLVMIDPKRIELSGYEDIPHLIQNVVTDPEDAMNALNWAVYEMERRYELLQEAKVRDITTYNQKISDQPFDDEIHENYKLPYIVLIVDEFADLIMTAGREIELPIARLAQMARAVGIHIILATQRPSIKVITGVIKANFPARIAFRVSSKVDSRVILDSTGADKLLGRGDMLFLPPGKANPERIHGAFLSDAEIEGLVEYLKTQPKPKLDIVMSKPEEISINDFEYDDELFPEAAKVVVATNAASVSMLQRHFKIGYARAGRLIDLLERAGVIGPHVGSKSREVLLNKEDIDAFYEKITN